MLKKIEDQIKASAREVNVRVQYGKIARNAASYIFGPVHNLAYKFAHSKLNRNLSQLVIYYQCREESGLPSFYFTAAINLTSPDKPTWDKANAAQISNFATILHMSGHPILDKGAIARVLHHHMSTFLSLKDTKDTLDNFQSWRPKRYVPNNYEPPGDSTLPPLLPAK